MLLCVDPVMTDCEFTSVSLAQCQKLLLVMRFIGP